MEDYKRKFGLYLSEVLADRVYQTWSNKLFCVQNGICLAAFRTEYRRYIPNIIRIIKLRKVYQNLINILPFKDASELLDSNNHKIKWQAPVYNRNEYVAMKQSLRLPHETT